MTYEVYVGNVSTTVSTEKLKNLFSQVGEILSIWINPTFEKITYAFIEFTNLIAAEETCRRFDNQKLDFFEIKVRLSDQTKKKLSYRPNRPNNSILLELPQKTGCSKNHSVKKILVKNLRENKEIIKDFTEACAEAENIASNQQFEIEFVSEPPNLTTLETSVVRYFKSTSKKNTLQVDFDLSKGKLLTTEQNDKFFNMQLTQPRPIVEQKTKQKKTIPFALDYRSVCD